MGCDGERERERKKDDRRTDGRTASTNFALPNIFGVKTSDFVATYKTQQLANGIVEYSFSDSDTDDGASDASPS